MMPLHAGAPNWPKAPELRRENFLAMDMLDILKLLSSGSGSAAGSVCSCVSHMLVFSDAQVGRVAGKCCSCACEMAAVRSVQTAYAAELEVLEAASDMHKRHVEATL